MRYFFIDYENVNKDGMNGIAKLSEEDCVRIYYSEDAQTMTFGLHRRIVASESRVEYVKVIDRIPNALDCRILFDVRDYIRQDKAAEYYIVSKDKHFDAIVAEFGGRGIHLRKIPAICSYGMENAESGTAAENREKNPQSEQEKKEQMVRSFFGKNLKEYDAVKEEIIRAVLTAKTRQQLNRELQKTLRDAKLKDVYARLKPLTKDLPGR